MIDFSHRFAEDPEQQPATKAHQTADEAWKERLRKKPPTWAEMRQERYLWARTVRRLALELSTEVCASVAYSGAKVVKVPREQLAAVVLELGELAEFLTTE